MSNTSKGLFFRFCFSELNKFPYLVALLAVEEPLVNYSFDNCLAGI